MSATPPTTDLDPATPPLPPPPSTANAAHVPPISRAPGTRARRGPRPPLTRSPLRHFALLPILVLSAVLGTNRLSQNGYANTFYAAAVKSMLHSFHDFLYVSFDQGGLVTIDKPPLAVWVQAVSAKLFGFSPLSLLLPQAIIAVISVAALYWILQRRLGTLAGLAGALALAVFPSFVAVSRENGVDPLLILLMILACGAALRAIEDGRWRWLIASAVLIGLAFNVKTLAAYLAVPGIVCAYLLCAPGSWQRRIGMLAGAGAAMLVVSFAWIAFVELTPASQRPYVGSSTNNTELGLTFEYNGLGRVEGEVGGPGKIPIAEGGLVRTPPHKIHFTHPPTPEELARLKAFEHREAILHAKLVKEQTSTYLPNGHLRSPITFGGEASPLRLFEKKLFDQGSWMLPFALIGAAAFALLALIGARTRRDRRLATLIVLGGWMLVEAVILDFSKGIVHPYYISALGPGVAAMVAAGAYAFARFARAPKDASQAGAVDDARASAVDRSGEPDTAERSAEPARDPRPPVGSWRLVGLALLAAATVATVVVQVAILHYEHYLHWFTPVLAVGAVLLLAAACVRRFALVAIALLVCLLLYAPARYSATTWGFPVEGTFPAAGPHQATGDGEYGSSPASMRIYHNLIDYVDTHDPGTRWSVLTVSVVTAAPMILLGSDAGGIAGYSGTDPTLNGPGLARLVERHEARYIVLGGAYASRGGNLATKAVLHVCPQVPYQAWGGPVPSTYSLVLFDCAHSVAALRAQRGQASKIHYY